MATIRMVKAVSFRNKANIRHHLSIKPMTSNELAEAIHVVGRTVNAYLKLMRADNEVRVCGHRLITRLHGRITPVPLYELGSAPDKVYRAQTKAEARKLEWARIQADTERLGQRRAKSRARNLKATPQDELAFFFGKKQ